MSTGADQRIGSELAGYRITALLGRGGMSAVYLAEDERLGRRVALKLLAPELSQDERFRRRFLRESRLAASIEHSHIVPIYEAGEADGVLYIAMRRVEGTDLRELLRSQGPLEPARALALLEQVAEALDAAHERGLVHRDVKPSNVLVARESGRERCYLSDFGLTKSSASLGDLSEAGHLVGTIDYVAPEQIEGAAVDGRADVYSLACLLFECLAGDVPFLRDSDLAVLWAHVQDPPPSLQERRPSLPPALDTVIAQGMVKEREERYPTCGELVAAAQAALAGQIPPDAVSVRQGRRRRAGLLAAAAATATAAALGVLALIGKSGGEATATPFRPGIVIVDQATGEQIASIPTSVVREPDDVIFTGGHFWVEEENPLSLVQIDAATGTVQRKIPIPSDEVGEWTAEGDTLWVTGRKVWKFDISLGRQIDRFDRGGWHTGIVVAAGSVWLGVEDRVLRLDPETGRVLHRFAPIPELGRLVYADGFIWAGGSVEINRIDPVTNAVTTTKLHLPEDFGRIAAGGGFGWTADPTKGLVYKIDSGGRVVDTYETGEGAGRGLSYSNGELWVANGDEGTVSAIDGITGAQRTFSFGHPVRAIAAGSGVLVATLAPGRTYEDKIDDLEGRVARLYVPLHMLEGPDPAGSGNFWVEQATCAGLVRYPDAPAPDGWKLQPELAAAMPEVSPDGSVYSFEIRNDYRFSPPSNEVVTAETMVQSIERALSPKVTEQPPLLEDIVGVRAFRAGKADHVSGLRANGNTLTITLTEASPDFLARLAVPFYCAVPRDTPLVPGGIGQYVGYPRETPQAIPAAGPYYIADRLNGEFTILKRNPNYKGPRPHALDAIAMREGVDAGKAVSRVLEESWDGMVGSLTNVSSQDLAPLLEVGGELDQRWGAKSRAASAGDRRYYTSATPGTGYLLFNSRRGLFADRAVRRAAAHAIDRRAIAALWKQASTDQVLPAALPGFRDTSFYRLEGPDLARARSLMNGRTGVAVMGIFRDCGSYPCLQTAQLVKAELSRIGIRVRLEVLENPWEAARAPGSAIDILDSGWGIYEADPASFLHALLSERTIAALVPRGLGAEADRINSLHGAARVAAAAGLADRLVADDVAVAAYGNDVVTTFLSPRLGCRVFPPLGYGLDLAALCLEDGT